MRAEIITLREGLPSAATIAAGVTGVVLAGSRDERFAGMDRGLIHVGGRPLIKRVLEQLVLQVRQIVVVTGRNEWLYAAYGYRVIADPDPESRDPLSAIVKALGSIETTHGLFVPADAARLPPDLGARLWQAHAESSGAPCSVRGADGTIPECCLIAKSERGSAEQALGSGQTLAEWLASRQAVEVDFRDWPAPFWGLGSPADVAPLETALRG
jgi:molybdopterin-guanine dinucleotide biosynthesis protein A